jgi:hypothetical protein
MTAPDIGASHYNTFRLIRAFKIGVHTLHTISMILLLFISTFALICHEVERTTHRRKKH